LQPQDAADYRVEVGVADRVVATVMLRTTDRNQVADITLEGPLVGRILTTLDLRSTRIGQGVIRPGSDSFGVCSVMVSVN
jgi:hypothetical protein